MNDNNNNNNNYYYYYYYNYGPFRVSSHVGPQQGDPVGPLLLYNSVQPLLNSM